MVDKTNTALFIIICIVGLALAGVAIYLTWREYKKEGMLNMTNPLLDNEVSAILTDEYGSRKHIAYPGEHDLDDIRGGKFARFGMGPQLVGPSRWGSSGF